MQQSRFARMSAAEMARRHALVAATADALRLDAVVAVGDEDDMSGYVRWFTDEPVSSYRTVVMFVPAEGVTVIEHGNAGGSRAHDPAGTDYPGVVGIATVASFQSAAYTAGYEAATLIEIVRKRGFSRIGLAGVDNMPNRFVRMIHDGLAGPVAFEDVTDAVDRMMVVKSPEELGHVRAAAALQDDVFAQILPQLRPGMREIEITALARSASLRMGGAGGVILAGSAPQGQFAPFKLPNSQTRVVEAGDYVSLLIENAGPSGHFTELARNIVIGKALPVLLAPSAEARALQAMILPVMRPGASCADVFAEHNRHRLAAGHPAETRIFAHGQGYNLVERPLIRDDEPMELLAGMNLAVHPTLADGRNCFVVMCDNFVLGEDGSMMRLHRTEQKVFEI